MVTSRFDTFGIGVHFTEHRQSANIGKRPPGVSVDTWPPRSTSTPSRGGIRGPQ